MREAAAPAFLPDRAVPCDTNHAGRDLRMLKVQEVPGACRDAAPLHKQARHVLTASEPTFADHPPLPSLQSE